MKIVALIQCTAGDIGRSAEPDDYAIGICRESGLFDAVALACPDQPASTALEDLAAKWDVPCHRGDEFNVGHRLLMAARAHDADIVVRVLLRQFYLDTDQVARMVSALRVAGAAYVTLPADYNYALAGDVCTADALARAVEEIDALPEGRDQASFRFSPWVYMERHPDRFPVVAVDGGPAYTPERAHAIRAKYRKILSENQTHFAWNFPASSYRFLGQYLKDDWRVLDIACGKGQGVRCLGEFCAEAVGVDLDPDNIAQARADNGHIAGLDYRLGDAETFLEEGAFDAVISLHTLEHLGHPERFFECTDRNLKPGGRLLLEVPLLMAHPMGMPLVPWHEKEYLLPDLLADVEAGGFVIDDVWVKQRHAFLHLGSRDNLPETLPAKVTAGLVLAHKPVGASA